MMTRRYVLGLKIRLDTGLETCTCLVESDCYATAATQCPGMILEHSKPKSMGGFYRPYWLVTLYVKCKGYDNKETTCSSINAENALISVRGRSRGGLSEEGEG